MLHRTIQLYRNSFGGLSKDIWLLALVTLINRSGTMVIPFMTVYLTSQLHFSLGQAGWVMTCFGVGSVLGSLLGGKLTDTFGYYWVQFWALLLSGAMFLVLMQVQSFGGMCGTIFLLSIVADAFRPANHASIAVYSKPENRTRSYSLIRLAINLGFSIGPAVGGFIAGAHGFKWLFLVDGLTCMSAALFLLFSLKQKQEPANTSNTTPQAAVVTSAYHDRTFLWFALLTTICGVVFMQLFSTLPVFYREGFGLSESQIGALLALNGLMIAILEMPFVYTLERKAMRRLPLIGKGALLIGASFFMLELSDFWGGVLILSVITVTFGEMLTMPFSNVYALERSTPATRGQYMAVYSGTWSLAHILAPALGMQIAQHWGFNTLWYVLTGLCIVAFLGYRLLEKRPAAIATQPG
ncbi:MAG TPA: MFS transporter [Saprospiraceae bacterium]|nr:MFS transporter [Saprospiraceae bacterium]HMP13280.1 MFS transporter [Saprospiraceae bacterium]